MLIISVYNKKENEAEPPEISKSDIVSSSADSEDIDEDSIEEDHLFNIKLIQAK